LDKTIMCQQPGLAEGDAMVTRIGCRRLSACAELNV